MSLGNWLIQKVAHYMQKEVREPRNYLCDFSRICHEVRPADVLLIEGRNRISRIVQNTTKSAWTHSALYIGRIHNLEDPKLREYVQQQYKGPIKDQLLIETQLGQGSIIVPITKYKKEHVRVCRPSGLSYDDGQRVIAFAVNTIGQEYDLRHFFDLYRFLVSSKFIPRTWNSIIFKKPATSGISIHLSFSKQYVM